MKRIEISDRILLMLGLLGYLILLLITIYHKQPPLFDEILFIPNIHLFEKYGLSKEFLLKLDNQAPGPLYQFIHYPLRSITHLQTPAIRLVNVFILGLIILVISKIIVVVHKTSFYKSFVLSLNIMAVPMIWQVSGMALTEVPTLLFASLSVYLLSLSVKKEEENFGFRIITAVGGGLALGLAIMGRSPFLLITLAAAVLLYNNIRDYKRWTIVGLYVVCALSISLPVFFIWQGLVPPQQMHVGAGGISIWHGVLAFAYGALLTFLIAPKWFYFNKKIIFYLLGLYFIFLIANICFLDYKYYPLSEALDKVFPDSFMEIYPYIISPFLITLSIYFIVCCLIRARDKRSDSFFLFLLLSAMLILATSFKVTHLFSSRYVAQAAPFFVLLLVDYEDKNAFKAGRFLLGMAIGLLSLETYFLFK